MRIEDVDRELARYELTAFRDQIVTRHLPCVHLQLGPACAADAPGNRIGGLPILASGEHWPLTDDGAAMTFVQQIDLATLPAIAGVGVPRVGLLALFVGAAEPAYDIQCSLVLTPPDASLAAVSAHTDKFANDVFAGLPPHVMHPRPGVDFPGWHSSGHEAIAELMDEAEAERFEDFCNALAPEPVCGKLFGHATGIGADPREDAYIMREVDPKLLFAKERHKMDLGGASRWRNLMAVDSCRELDLCIWDAGYLGILVKDSDLAVGKLDAHYAQIESS